jgi:2-oxo-3-hexenedioate decarboxylase
MQSASADAVRQAERVLAAFDSRELISPLTVDDPSLGTDDAYAVALEIYRRRLARGEVPVGRKIGFTNRSIWPAYGIAHPMWGHMYDSTVHFANDASATISVAGLLQPRIEPEIQLHFARTPPVTDDEQAILGCVDWIAQGFEIVQCPYPSWRFAVADAIAAFGVHGALVVGPPVRVSNIEGCAEKLRSFTIALIKDGSLQAEGVGSNVLGSPLLAFAHLGEVLSRQSRFAPVHAGEVITTGTLTDLFPVSPGENWSATISGIELPRLSISIE